MEIIDDKALLIRTRAPEKFRIIPKSKVVADHGDGRYEVLVRWGLDEARVLRNLGVRDVPSPIERKYNWPGRRKPFMHQIDTASFLTFNRRAFNFSEPGTGKTLPALWAADYLMTLGMVRRVCIACPLSIMDTAWLAEIGRSIIHRSAAIAYSTDARKRREIVRKGYEFIITNYEGVALISDAIIEDGTFDLFIIDEANAYKNPSTQRWKALNKLLRPDTHLWMMTGTPAPQSPLDAYGLAKLVNANAVPKFFTGWRDKVMNKVSMFRWVPKPDAKERVFEALQPAVRYTKAQCVDLPPVLTVERHVPLTPQQEKYYRLLKERLLVQAAGETVSAVNAAAVVNKLLQISAGAAYTDNQEVIEFDCSPRLNVLMEVLEETSRKVLVFAPYRHSIDTISAFLTKNGIANEQIHGDVPPSKRTLIFKQFQESIAGDGVQSIEDPALRRQVEEVRARTMGPRVLVIQPQAAAHGVTLTAADTVVFWGPVMSVETYLQCIARSDRVGQNSDKVTVVHLHGSAMERKMFQKLADRVDDHVAIISLYEEEVVGKAVTVV